MAGKQMARRTLTAPRRTPRQERAQDTVEVILGAAARVMSTEGYEHATTNRIALVAGVSIGSLYRYFPSKDALLAALYERHSAETMAGLAATIAATRHAPLAIALRAVLQAEFRAHSSDAPLHRVLCERILHTDARAHFDSLLERYVCLVRDELIARSAEIGDVDPDRAAFMVVHTIHALSHAALQHRLAYFMDEAYLDECIKLILRYLQRDSPAGLLFEQQTELSAGGTVAGTERSLSGAG
jgi:AcrR family transcriptional regulator